MKQVRKAVRTFLINDNKVIVIKYKTNKNMNYYDIPGGKVEENESAIDASIREFKEETGITLLNPILKGIEEFKTKDEDRYFIFFYVASEYLGEISSNSEGAFGLMKKIFLIMNYL